MPQGVECLRKNLRFKIDSRRTLYPNGASRIWKGSVRRLIPAGLSCKAVALYTIQTSL
jgi:hypothetical protein